MALVSGRGRGSSNRLSGSLASLRQRMAGTKTRIQGYKSQIGGYKSAISNYKSQMKTTDDAYWDSASGKAIRAINQSMGFNERGVHDLSSKFTDTTKSHYQDLLQGQHKQKMAQSEYDERMKSTYKSGHMKHWMQNEYRTAGDWLTGFFKVMTGQKKMQEWVDTTETKRDDSRRWLAREKQNVANIKSRQSGIGDLTMGQLEKSIETYKTSAGSEESLAYGEQMKNLSEGLTGTQEAQNTTLKQLQAQQAQASQLESSMAHMTSLFAGAKRKEQMEGMGTGKKGGKQQARLGQGYA